MKASEFKKLVQTIVQEEFNKSAKKYIQMYVPAVVGEVVKDLVDKRINEIVGGSSKVRLTEEEEWPTLGGRTLTTATAKSPSINREKLSALLGYGDGAHGRKQMNTIEMTLSDNGAPIPITKPIPEDLVVALNKDYRSVLRQMGARNDNPNDLDSKSKGGIPSGAKTVVREG